MRYLALLVLLAACGDAFAPTGAVSYTPPAYYALLWDSVRTCSGRGGDMARITWFRAPATGSFGSFPDQNGRPVLGLWIGPHSIYLSSAIVDYEEPPPSSGDEFDWILWWDHHKVPAHEMLHDLLQTPDHPAVFDTCDMR